ncbi:MAG: YdeI/OmpD-associated family protein [Pirellulaceae bacterium]
MKRYKSVEAYIDGHDQWHDELIKLREIANSTELVETVKWGSPTYTINGKNVVGIGAFKSYVGLWFFQGALLDDTNEVLINCQDGKTKAMRQWRFGSGKEIKVRSIKSYIKEAIELAKQGREIKPERGKPVVMPPKLKSALKENKKAGAAFEKLSLGKRREYAEYIAEAKRDDTKVKRLAKIMPMIVAGQGLNDKYRKA